MAYSNERDGIRSVSSDLRALQDAGYDTRDAGKGMSDRDIHRESNDKHSGSAGHTMRDDAAREGGWGVPSDRHGSSSSDGGSGGSGK